MNSSVKNALSFAAGLITGGVTGFMVAQRTMKTALDKELEEQIKDVKEHYKLLRKDGEYSSPIAIAENYDEVLEGLEYLSHKSTTDEASSDDESEYEEEDTETEEVEVESETEEVEDIQVGNVFERNQNEPYVISTLDFMNGEDSFDKITITYFEEDDTLCDEREEVIPNVEATVGTEALTKFGHLSDDSKIVYVRNERIKTDFEIALDTRSYTEVVLGFKEEKEVRKMREDD